MEIYRLLLSKASQCQPDTSLLGSFGSKDQVRKILIVKLSAIGDVIHCLPVAAALKEAMPDAQISWLVEQTSAELLQGNQVIDEVIVFQAKSWVKQLSNPAKWLAVLKEA